MRWMKEDRVPTGSTVVVAMSGGVDSSVAAALLVEAGYTVVGITMHLWDFEGVGGNIHHESGCCSLSAMNDARMVCHRLGIPHYVVDFRDTFRETVIQDFIHEYARGRTPNPCVLCNVAIKWKALLWKVESLGGHWIATGHYARVRWDDTRARFVLLRGVDKDKDQAYALWRLPQDALSKTLFPLGSAVKEWIREKARALDLKTAGKRESQEICFVPDNDYARFLWEKGRVGGRFPPTFGPGPIEDTRGHILGYHRGVAFYTTGQRKGLGIATGRPMYVTRIYPERNTLQVGGWDDLLGSELIARDVNWIAVEEPMEPVRVEVQIRYRHMPAPALVFPEEHGAVRVRFNAPQRAITPGQSVVFYQGDMILGGGIIEEQV